MEDEEKMATFFVDKKKERETQLKERKKKKLLDGSGSAVRKVGTIRVEETRLKQGLTTLPLLLAQQHALPPPK
jgi:hypothetical protein